jgi:hypothetical protein
MESHQVLQVIVPDEKERLAGIIFLTLSHRICAFRYASGSFRKHDWSSHPSSAKARPSHWRRETARCVGRITAWVLYAASAIVGIVRAPKTLGPTSDSIGTQTRLLSWL